jgi:integrase
MAVRKRVWTTKSGERKESWIVDYVDQAGERHIQTFNRKKEADAYRDAVGVDVRAGTHTPVSRSITVAEATQDWIKAAELEGLETTTVDQRRQHARHINDRIGQIKLANLSAPRINDFRDELLETLSRPMARKVLSSLKSVLRDAQRRGNVSQNTALSAKRIDPDKRGKRKLEIGVDIPTADEIKALIAALSGNWRPVFLTAIFTGLRSSELRGLRWQDVDLRQGKLQIRQRADRYNVIGKPKSEAGNRTVKLGPLVVNALREWKLKCPKGEHDLVFPTRNGHIARHNNLVRAFKRTGKKAGLVKANGTPKYTGLHCLRHFTASLCINSVECGGQGLQPKEVQELLGHASITMTMDTYGHLFPRNADADQKLAAAERALLS